MPAQHGPTVAARGPAAVAALLGGLQQQQGMLLVPLVLMAAWLAVAATAGLHGQRRVLGSC